MASGHRGNNRAESFGFLQGFCEREGDLDQGRRQRHYGGAGREERWSSYRSDPLRLFLFPFTSRASIGLSLALARSHPPGMNPQFRIDGVSDGALLAVEWASNCVFRLFECVCDVAAIWIIVDSDNVDVSHFL